jgi:hypothetical protein
VTSEDREITFRTPRLVGAQVIHLRVGEADLRGSGRITTLGCSRQDDLAVTYVATADAHTPGFATVAVSSLEVTRPEN